MHSKVSELQRILGQVAKEVLLMVSALMEELYTLSDSIGISDKRFGLKIAGKPCEGKPHARFDEGLQGRTGVHTCDLLYSIK